MSALDSFLSTVQSEIAVDEAKRGQIEQALRAYLEAAVARATEKGLDRENAEREVLVAFGGSTWLARGLGARGGRRWLHIESLVLGVLWALLLWFFVREWTQVSGEVLLALLGWLGLLKRSYDRVEIHDGLLIRRLGRRKAYIPFENVTAIRFETGHLFGRRSVVVEHLGGTDLLSHQLRGMRLAIIALHALCPERMDPEVWEYQQRLPVRIRRERPAARKALALGWAIVLAVVLAGVGRSWVGLGAGLELALGYVAAYLVLFLQSLFHADRRRAAICTSFFWFGIAAPVLLGLGLFGGDTVLIRWGLIVLLLMPAMGLLLLAFRRGRLRVAAIPVGLALLAMGFVWVFRPTLPESELTLQASVTPSFQWLDDSRFWGTGFGLSGIEREPSCVSWGNMQGDVRTLPLDDPIRTLLPERPGGQLYLMAFGSRSGPKRHETIYRLSRLDTHKEVVEEVTTYPTRLGPVFRWNPEGGEVWSPSGNRLVGFYHRGDSQPGSIALYDWVSEATQALAPAGWRNYAIWEDENTLRLMQVKTTEGEAKRSPFEESFRICISKIDLKENRVELVREWARDPADSVSILSSGRHILIDDSEVEIETGFVSHIRHSRCVLLDTATGKETPLGWRDRSGYAESHSWDPSRGLFAYIASATQGSGQRLVVLDVEKGFVAEREFAKADQIDCPCLSPDGTRVAYLRSRLVGWGRGGMRNARLEVWDIARGRTSVVQNCGLGGTLLGYTFLGPSSLPKWSPDGKLLAYPDMNFMTASVDWRIEIVSTENLP